MLSLSSEQRDQIVRELGTLLKEKVSLQQSLREQKEEAIAQSEELFLELLEVADALEFLLDYMAENPDPSPEFISNLPKSLAAVSKKFLTLLGKRQVYPLELEGTQPDFNICQVVDCEVRADLEEHTITKIVRKGFRFGDKILRPIEVITSKTEEIGSETPPSNGELSEEEEGRESGQVGDNAD